MLRAVRATSRTLVKRIRNPARELGPCRSSKPSGSFSSAPLKDMSARKSFMGWMMQTFLPPWA